MTQVKPRRTWKDRERAAVLRFHRYAAALSEHGHNGMKWNVTEDRARGLFKDGGALLRELRKLETATTRRRSIRRLERVVSELAEADGWSHRHQTFLKGLAKKARSAFRRLVSLGFNPDQLVYVLELQADDPEKSEDRRQRERAYRARARALARDLEKLARECEDYDNLDRLIPEQPYRLARDVPQRLTEEARRIRAGLQASDPRRREKATRAESWLFQATQDIKVSTGEYRDELLACVLAGTPRVKAASADSLKKWRIRQAKELRDRKPRGEHPGS